MKTKSLFLTLILAVASAMASAQIHTAWTTDMPSKDIPSGVTVPDIDTLTNPTTFRVTIDLDKSTYDNDNKVTAFNALMAGMKTELDSNYVEEVWGWHNEDDLDVVYKVKNVTPAWDNFDGVDKLEMYAVSEDVYRILVVVKYVLR